MPRTTMPKASVKKLGVRYLSRMGRKGHLYEEKRPPPMVAPEEMVRIIKRRIQKAERDERMDITLALTPVKTYVILVH